MNYGQGPITTEQLELLLDFLDDHRDLAQGRLRAFDSREKAKKLWEEITDNLNSVSGGSIKTVQQWQKVWADRKHLAKKNAVANTISAAAKDGETSCRGPLSQTEVRIIDILGDSFDELQMAKYACTHKFDDEDSSDAISQAPVTSRQTPSKRQSSRETSSKRAVSPTWLGTPQNIAAQNSQSPLTTEQLDILLDFMDEHRDLASGRLKRKDYKMEARKLWEEISNMLNSVVGSFKTVQQWQKVWADRKHLAKKNAAAKSLDDTVPLSQTELRILSIVGDSSGEMQTKREPANPQEFDLEEASDSQPSLSETLPQNVDADAETAEEITVVVPLEETMMKDFEEENCSRGQHTTEQLHLLLNFMDKHRDLARGSLRNEEALVKANRLWEELTDLLNSVDGCVKSMPQWKKVWADRKHLARKKAAANKKYASAPDTRLFDLAPLLEWEQKILDILGISYEVQTTFPQNFDDDDDDDDELSRNSFSSHCSQPPPLTSSQPPQTSSITADNNMVIIPEADTEPITIHFEEEQSYSHAPDVTADADTEEESHFQARTTEQLDFLLNFMDAHRDLARGRLRNAKGRVKAKQLWDEVTNSLNSLHGSVKTVEQWQKVWADRKHLAKKNAAAKKISAASSIGGSSDGVPLTEWEQRILSIVDDNMGEPLIVAPASPQNFEMEDKLASDYISSQHSPFEEMPQAAVGAENGIVIVPEVMIEFKEENHNQEPQMEEEIHFEEYPPPVPTTSSQSLSLPPSSSEPLALPQDSQENEEENTNLAITTEQLFSLLDFMDEHRDLARGRLRNIKGRAKAKQLWEEITNTLNSYLHGSVKTIPQWQKVWADRKHLARKNAMAKKSFAAATSGGAPDELPLSEWELRILRIVGDSTTTIVPAPPRNYDSEEESDPFRSTQKVELRSSKRMAANRIEFIPTGETKTFTRKREIKTKTKCRVCLKEGHIYIFRDNGPHDISKYITTFTGILIKRNDDLPKHICHKCYELLQSAILFRKTAQLTNLLLKRKRRLAFRRLKEKSCTEKPIEINIEFEDITKPKAECERKNVSVKREPSSEDDDNMDDCDNDAKNVSNTDSHIKRRRSVNDSDSDVELKKTKRESQSAEKAESTRKNLSVKHEVDSEDENKCDYENDNDDFDTASEKKVYQTSNKKIKKEKVVNKSLSDSTYIEHMKIRKKVAEIIKMRKRIDCEICGKELYNSECYIKHMRSVHEVEPDPDITKSYADRIECEICQKLIVYFKYYHHVKNVHYVHMYTKQAPPKPKTKQTKTMQKPRQKVKTKPRIKKKQCTICKRSFNPSYYVKHMDLHRMKENGDSRRYICETCGKMFRLQNTLTMHLSTHRNEFPYKCTLCPYRGRTKELLKQHVKIHTGIYPHKCKQCPYRSVSRSNLNKHMRQHVGFTFFCETCKKGCYTQADLEKHVKANHLGIKDHVCNLCGMAFGYRKAMMKHLLKVHKRAKLKPRAQPSYLRSENEGSIGNMQLNNLM